MNILICFRLGFDSGSWGKFWGLVVGLSPILALFPFILEFLLEL